MRIARLGSAVFTSLLLAASAVAAESECEACRWSDRGDRREGIVVDSELVSGGSFELLSVHVRRASKAAAGSGQALLSFWLPEPAELDEIVVWQPRADFFDYRLEPHRKQYGGGRQSFSWPRDEVLDPLGLAIDSLFVRIKAGEVYFPALLSADDDEPAPEAPETGYAFVFRSSAGIDAECRIRRRDENGPAVGSFEHYEEVGGTIALEWDGRDDRGRLVPGGVYVFEIEGEMLAETIRPLRRSVSFWHAGSCE